MMEQSITRFAVTATRTPRRRTGGFISCTQTDPTTIVLKEKTNGPDSTNTRWELSADGKTLTAIHKLIQIGGSTKDKQLVYARDSGTSGFSGRWKATNPFDSLSKTVVLILNYNAFHFESQDWGQFSDSRVDESPNAHPRRQPALRILTLRKDPRPTPTPDRRHLCRSSHPTHHLEGQ